MSGLDLLLSSALIFTLRVVDISMYTLRVLMVVRGRKLLAMLFAFFQALVYIQAARLVFADLGNMAKVLGYASGFASGLVVGMLIESHLAIGYSRLRVISASRGLELEERLREAGYGVTEVAAKGMNGMVTLLECDVFRRDARRVEQLIAEIDSQAFVTSQAVRPLQRGFWHR